MTVSGLWACLPSFLPFLANKKNFPTAQQADPQFNASTAAYWLLCGIRPRRLQQAYAKMPGLPPAIRNAKRNTILQSKQLADRYVYYSFRLAISAARHSAGTFASATPASAIGTATTTTARSARFAHPTRARGRSARPRGHGTVDLFGELPPCVSGEHWIKDQDKRPVLWCSSRRASEVPDRDNMITKREATALRKSPLAAAVGGALGKARHDKDEAKVESPLSIRSICQ